MIEVDATLVEPVSVQRLAIDVAQRYSFIITANQSASSNYWIRAHMNTYCYVINNPVLNPEVRALLTYTNTTTPPNPSESVDWSSALELECQDLDPNLLVPSAPQNAPPADVVYQLDISFQIGAYAIDLAYINSTSWVPLQNTSTVNLATAGLQADNTAFNTTGLSTAYPSSQFILNPPDMAVVDILIENFDDGAHPFHMHGHVFWVLDSSPTGYFNWSTYDSIDTTNPVRRDTVTVQQYGWVLIRFVNDNPGLWALHCHIVWHLEAGMMLQIQGMNSVMKDWTIPNNVLGLCEA